MYFRGVPVPRGRAAGSAGSGDGVPALERHCRLLLRAYPAAYRQDRGEEIIGTLLEATPAGRSWPLPRDIRGLVVGGLRARAALNQGLTTGANLRVAIVAGAAVYLACTAASDVIFAVFTFTHRHGGWRLAEWPLLLVGALVGLTVASMWGTRRRAVLIAELLAAAVVVLLVGHGWSVPGWSLPELACLVAVTLFAGRDTRLCLGWLWPAAPVVALMLVQYLMPGVSLSSNLALKAAVTLGILSLLWVVVDARPAIAMAVFLLALWLPLGIASLIPPDIGAEAPLLLVIGAAAVAVWRLHRQSAGGRASTAD